MLCVMDRACGLARVATVNYHVLLLLLLLLIAFQYFRIVV